MNFGRRSSIITCATPARDVKDWSFSNESNEPDSKEHSCANIDRPWSTYKSQKECSRKRFQKLMLKQMILMWCNKKWS